jgi:hypothetical protein
MRSFATLLTLLFAFFAFALAQESAEYDATVYVTSTVYRVNTVTLSGTPTGVVANQTSVISAVIPSAPTVTPIYSTGNGTIAAPTGTGAAPSSSSPVDFQGAASAMSINAGVVAVMAGAVAFFAL